MGVYVNGKWHEELADPSPSGGSNLTSVTQSPSYGGGGGTQTAAAPAATTMYQTVNGPKTLEQMSQELHNAGWDGTGNVTDVYARTTGGTVGAAAPGGTGADVYGYYLQQALAAAAAGDKARFDEAIRQFNQNFGIAEAGITGMYQGHPTLQAQNQAYTQQLGVVNAAAALQTNPFRQAEIMGQAGRLLTGQGVAGFQAPGQATGQTDFSGMGNLQRLIDDIKGGPGSVNGASVNTMLNAIPTPNRINSTEFLRASPGTQNLILSGMQTKYGLDPAESLSQIKATLPQFTAPSTFGQIRG
jgi:hypothetical protein